MSNWSVTSPGIDPTVPASSMPQPAALDPANSLNQLFQSMFRAENDDDDDSDSN